MVLEINKIARNFLSIGVSNILGQVLTFLIGTYYAKILGTTGFGNITLVQAIIMYFNMIVLFGLQTFGTREISKDKRNIETITGNILVLRLIIFIICYIVILITSFIFRKDIVFNVLLPIYGISLLPYALNIDWVFMGLQDMQYNGVYNIIRNFIPCILIYLFLKSSNQITLVPIFTIVGLVFGSLYQLYIYFFKEKLKLKINLNKRAVYKYLSYGSPFLISGILAMINCNVDRIIIGFVISKSDAGIYASAYYIVAFLTSLITIIFSPVFPLYIEYFHHGNIQKLKLIHNNMAKIIAMIIVPITIGGLILAKDIILFVFGEQYIRAYVPFAILMVYSLLLFIRETYGYGLNAWNMEKKYLKIVAISSIVNLALNLLLIPKFGINIAAVTTTISEIINLIFMKKYACKIINLNYCKYIIKISPAAFIMTISVIILKFINLNVILNIVLSASVYVFFILIFKYITLDEIKSFFIKKQLNIKK